MTDSSPAARTALTVLPEATWRARQAAHHERADVELAAHRERASRGIKHPIDDFLFEYYSFRPGQLRRWHPGHGVVLENGQEYLQVRDYHEVAGVVGVDVDAVLAHRSGTVLWADRLLRAVAGRRAAFGCFGMHEWAMVRGVEPEQTRHPQLGLRISPEQVSATLDEVGLRCSHIDAVRFFTPSAVPLNELQPTRATQSEFDNPGCLHVGMDLYKVAYKLSPLTPTDLLWRCFELAREIRRLDMQASPYDLSRYELPPVAVDTVTGRAEYVRRQREFSERAAPLRQELIDVVAPLVALARAARKSA